MANSWCWQIDYFVRILSPSILATAAASLQLDVIETYLHQSDSSNTQAPIAISFLDNRRN